MEKRGDLWTIKEAANYLGISTNTLRQHLAKGSGPLSLVLGPNGGLRKFRKTDLDAWLESRCVVARATKGKLNHIKE